VGTLSPGELLDRRRQLLADDEGTADELTAVTEALGSLLDDPPARVRRLTADDPPDLLARLVDGEPVHPFAGERDLADRLDEDRRCFVLEHPQLPDVTLNVVWCALWNGTPTDVAAVLDPDAATTDPHSADTAAFYSIWNVEPGLAGLSGGRMLLEGAVEALRAEFPNLVEFVTLSPIPGFRRWFEQQGLVAAEVGSELRSHCARYLLSLDDHGLPSDPVARFHLGNGARLVDIATDADHSPRGMERSFGLMANYRYEPEDRAANRRSLADRRPPTTPELAALTR
jgi:malonyl-CoA decarboxylase